MKRIFACSDLHGMWPLFCQINGFLTEEDRVFFLGDAGDRGPDGWKIIKAIMGDPRWIYLKGNHEQMLVDAMLDELNDEWNSDAEQLLIYNGGYETIEAWRMDGRNAEWAYKLNKLPTHISFENDEGKLLWLSHAGFTPGRDGKLIPDEYSLIWDRQHLTHRWPEGYDNFIIIHGHTPIPSMGRRLGIPVEEGALYYANGHKICIDNASFASGISCLLDLNSFDEHIFTIPNFNKL